MSKPKNLIIDGQILQTSAWHRGMGKYMLQVLHELSEVQPDGLQVSIIFNTKLEHTKERFEAVRFLCPNIKQVLCDMPVASDKNAKAEDYRAVLENCIEQNFAGQDNYYLISSLFYFDFFAEFPANCHKLVLLYDLTPLLFWKDLGGYFPPELYMGRFQRILEADAIFSISETTRQDLMKTFGLDPRSIMNIKGGFTKVAESAVKPKSFKVPPEYILFPTGDMPHKNNKLAVKGFEEYFKRSKNGLPLLITSQFHDDAKKELLSISDHVIYTGNVLDEELEWLYENASAILFASKYEGLGMPILDAVANKKPIITSKISVFEEMSKRAFYFFDPSDYQALANAIDQALGLRSFDAKLKDYPAILEEYSWRNTCRTIIDSLSNIVDATNYDTGNIAKPKVAVLSLHPGIAGQAGRLAEALHAQLSKNFDIDYYFDANGYHYKEMERPSFLSYFDNKPLDIIQLTARAYKKYDGLIYLLDPATFPSRVAQKAAVLPGIAVTDFGDFEFERQNDIFKDIAVDNQFKIYPLPGHSFEAYRKLAAELAAQAANINKKPIHIKQKLI